MSEGRDSRRQAGCGDVVAAVGWVMVMLIAAVCVGVVGWW
jgi:hypothetical protein